MLTKKIQTFLVELFHAGSRAPAGKVKQAVVKNLRGLIPFDMAIWASGQAADLKVNNTYLYNLPEAMMESWHRIKHQDKLLAGLIANPGKTFDVYDFYSTNERKAFATYRRHSKLFGIENAISTAIPNPDTGLLEILSLYRRDPEKRFSRSERLAKQFVFPVMSEVWHSSQIQHLVNRTKDNVSGSLAICDNRAWVRHAESEFIDLLRKIWPEWSGPVLPIPIAAWLKGKKTKFLKEGNLVLRRSNLNDMVLVQANNGDGMLLLTQREEQIAESFSAGLTYKEIARELALSPSTVRRHIESVYKKLEVSNKMELFQVVKRY